METSREAGKHILIVDDDQDVREILRLVLTRDGHSVTEARGGREALGLFCAGRFDLVITDFEMPEVNGEELVDNIRRLSPAQRIIMVSANAYRLKSPSSKVNLCIDKPFLIDDLRAAVSRVLEGC